jgi:hypothetical protein
MIKDQKNPWKAKAKKKRAVERIVDLEKLTKQAIEHRTLVSFVHLQDRSTSNQRSSSIVVDFLKANSICVATMSSKCSSQLYDDETANLPEILLICTIKRHHTRFFPPAAH